VSSFDHECVSLGEDLTHPIAIVLTDLRRFKFDALGLYGVHMKACREFGVNQMVSMSGVALGYQAIKVKLVVDERLCEVFLIPLPPFILILDYTAVECDFVNCQSFQVLRHRLFIQMYHPFFGWPVYYISWYVYHLLIGSLGCVTTFWGWEYDFVLEIQCHIYNYNMEKSVGTKIKKTPAFHP
jgi:hypothetical protein